MENSNIKTCVQNQTDHLREMKQIYMYFFYIYFFKYVSNLESEEILTHICSCSAEPNCAQHKCPSQENRAHNYF